MNTKVLWKWQNNKAHPRSKNTNTYIKMICIEKSKKVDYVMLHNYTVSDLIVATDDF